MAAARLRPTAWLPFLFLPVLAGIAASHLPAWIFMWVLAGSVFMGCKWLMLADACVRGARGSLRRRAGFLFAWPGMDAARFFADAKVSPTERREWLLAAGKTLFGALLYWGVARWAGGGLLTAWLGMIGLIFILHFGSFHLLSLAWRTSGVPAEPLMKNPIEAVSVGEFWSRRWNVAFNDIAERFVFRPLARRVGIMIASLAAFLVSGLIHDVVISIPARGGYGLPTVYFLCQGFGVWIERSRIGRRVGLRRGFRGWLFTLAVTAGPAFLLFHPPFAHRIVLPMMSATWAL